MGKRIRVGSTTTSLSRAKARAALHALYVPDEPVEQVAQRFAALGAAGVRLLEDVLLGDDVLDEEHDDPELASVIVGRAAAVLALVAGVAAIGPLVAVLELAIADANDEVMTSAIFALRELGPDAGAPLMAELDRLAPDDDLIDRALEGALCEALAECGAKSDDVYTRLLRHFEREPAFGAASLAAYGDVRAAAPIRARFDVDVATPPGADDGETDLRIVDLADALDSLGASWDDAARARVEAARSAAAARDEDGGGTR